MSKRKRIRITESQEMAINQYLIKENDDRNRRHNEFLKSEQLTPEDVDKIRSAVEQAINVQLIDDPVFRADRVGHKIVLPTRLAEELYPNAEPVLRKLLPDFDIYYNDDRRSVSIYRKGFFDRLRQIGTQPI